MNEIVFAMLKDERYLKRVLVHVAKHASNSVQERLLEMIREIPLSLHEIGDPIRFFLALLLGKLQIAVGCTGNLEALGKIGRANAIVFVRQHLLSQLRGLEDVLELDVLDESVGIGHLFVLLCCLQLQGPIVFGSVTKCFFEVLDGCLIKTCLFDSTKPPAHEPANFSIIGCPTVVLAFRVLLDEIVEFALVHAWRAPASRIRVGYSFLFLLVSVKEVAGAPRRSLFAVFPVTAFEPLELRLLLLT